MVEIIVIPCVSNQLNDDSAAVSVGERRQNNINYKGPTVYIKIRCASQLIYTGRGANYTRSLYFSNKYFFVFFQQILIDRVSIFNFITLSYLVH